MSYLSPAERVRQLLLAWVVAQGHGSKKRAAGAVGQGPQWFTAIKNRKQQIALDDLDKIAELLETKPGDLVRHPDDLYVEVAPSEFQFLKHLRMLPEPMRRHWLALLNLAAELYATIDAASKEPDPKPNRRYRRRKPGR